MPYISSSGVELYYDRSGQRSEDNEPVVPALLIAGMASDSASWHPVLSGLSEYCEVIRMDNRCAGQTQPMPVTTSRALMVNDVIALLNALEIEKVNLIGHSMGALIAWAVAASAPERINAVVAASAPITVDPTRIELFNTLARLRTADNEADWYRLLFQFLFSAKFFATDKQITDAVEASLAYPFKQSAQAFTQQCAALPSYLDAINLPASLPFKALALTGVNDKLFTPADLHKIYAEYQQVSLAVIDDAAHSVHWENTASFLSIVNTFLFD